MTSPDQTLEQRIQNMIDQAVSSVRRELESQIRIVAEAAGSNGHGGLSGLQQSLGALGAAETQSELLAALLEEAQQFSGRTAFFVAGEDGVRGWNGRGFDQESVAGARFDATHASWGKLLGGQGTVELGTDECSQVASAMLSSPGQSGILIPLMLRGQVAGALYADRLSSDQPLEAHGLQILTHVAGLSLETMPLRSTTAAAPHQIAAAPATAPAPRVEPPMSQAPVSEEPAGQEQPSGPSTIAGLAAAGAAGIAAVSAADDLFEEDLTLPGDEDEVDPDATVLMEIPYAEPPGLSDFAPTAGEPDEFSLPIPSAAIADGDPGESAVAYQGAETVETPLVEQTFETVTEETSPQPWNTQSPDFLGSELTDAPVEEEEAVPLQSPPVGEEEPLEAYPVDMLGSIADGVDDRGEEADEQPPEEQNFEMVGSAAVVSALPEPKPEPVSEVKVKLVGSQIIPPDDLQGPGTAFLSGLSVPDVVKDSVLEEAQRLARLLVSEIKLYNEEDVSAGRRSHDLYSRLRDDIDRSQLIFSERVDAAELGGKDPFREELVRILGGGDESTLGL